MTSSQDATGSTAVAGSAATRLRDATVTGLILSVLSLLMVLTVPIWSPKIYGNPGSEQFMVLGVAQLRPALLSSAPFRDKLTLVRRVMPSQPDVNQALETLAAYADKGVPTSPELRASFVEFATAIVLEDIFGTKPNQFDRTIISAAAAVRLHALAHWLHDTRPASAIVWEAKTRLDNGDLAGASVVLGMLTGPEAKLAEPWIRAAQSRIAANHVLDLLEAVAQSQARIPAQRS